MGEEWRDIIGYEGRYQVSNTGKVMTLGTGVTHKEKRLLKFSTSHGRYYIVALTKDGKTKWHTVHRLVAQCFIPNDNQSKDQIDHIDGDSFNNSADNLRWCTAQENNLNPITRVRKSESKKGKANPNHKSNLTDERYGKLMNTLRLSHEKMSKPVEQIFDGNVIETFKSVAYAEEKTGVCATNISRCCNGQRKRAGGFEWRFIHTPFVG